MESYISRVLDGTFLTRFIDELITLSQTLTAVALGVWGFLNTPVTTNLFDAFFEGIPIPPWVLNLSGAMSSLIIDFIKLPYLFAFNATPTYLQLMLFYAPLILVAPIVNWIWNLLKAIL